jgi:dTDP-N-acetylfucosamine:lipid II N-acetylfucosaminyltransferase
VYCKFKSVNDKKGERVQQIIHFVLDEKFINMAYREFEYAAPENNLFVLLGRKRTLKYINLPKIYFLSVAKVRNLLKNNQVKAVIFHSLNPAFLSLFKYISADIKIVWIGWGYDYYEQLLSEKYVNGLFLPSTHKLILNHPDKSLYAYIKEFAKVFLGRSSSQYSKRKMNRIDYFCPVLDLEYELCIELNPWFKPKYLTWNYGTVEDDLSIDNELKVGLGSNILVGNSATPENNHLEIFAFIKRNFDLSDKKIIVPLSYGDEWYKEKIIIEGSKMFGEKFIPLTMFIKKDDYFHLLDSCGFVFMNHLRQQAVANICIMILKGAKIYMNKKNPFYKWLINRGAFVDPIVYSVSTNRIYNNLTPLTLDKKKRNSSIIKKHWGSDYQQDKTKRLVDRILNTSL